MNFQTKAGAVKYTEVRFLIIKSPGYNANPSDGEAPVLELWRMWGTYSLPLLPDPLLSGGIIPVKDLSMGPVELFNHLRNLNIYRLTVCRQMINVKLNY